MTNRTRLAEGRIFDGMQQGRNGEICFKGSMSDLPKASFITFTNGPMLLNR